MIFNDFAQQIESNVCFVWNGINVFNGEKS